MQFKKRPIECEEKCTQTNEINEHEYRLDSSSAIHSNDSHSSLKILENSSHSQVCEHNQVNPDENISNFADDHNKFCSSSGISKLPPTYFKPFHIRLAEYEAKRAEIFKDFPLSKRYCRSSERIRNFWSTRRELLSVGSNRHNDLRPYASVVIFGKTVSSLLDTGATVICLGSTLAKEFLNSDSDFKRMKSFVHTADGQGVCVLGKVETEIVFRVLRSPFLSILYQICPRIFS